MAKSSKKRSTKSGLSPGALIHIGEKKAEQAKITLVKYDETSLQEREVGSVEECFTLEDARTIKWIHVAGIHQVDLIEKIGSHYGLHPLTLEDILNTDHRPKIDEHDDYIFIVLKMFGCLDDKDEIVAEQVSLVFRPGLVISFLERESSVFGPIRERMRASKSRIVKYGSDYLAYALIDAVVDQYFVVLEKLGERIEFLQEQVVSAPGELTLHGIHQLRREMIFLRRSAWPVREILNKMERGESPFIQESTTLYVRDVYDHVVQIIDTIETYREMVTGMIDIYLTSMSNKLNQVMKVLTIIATIFIPLTLISGIYGMNFQYMPELAWHWGYFTVLGVMVSLAAGMVFYFKKKKWF